MSPLNENESTDKTLAEAKETSTSTWAPYYGSRRSLRRYKSSQGPNSNVSCSTCDDTDDDQIVSVGEQGRQSWSPYYGSRRSMRRYEKSQHGEDPRSVTVEEVVSTIDVDCEFDEGNGNTFVRSFSKPATADGVNKQLQRSNSLSTKKLKNIFVFGNSSKLGEERQKGVVLFSATSFAQDIDDGISGTENVAYVPDDLVQDQEFGESMNTGHIAKADEVKSMLEILSKGKREPRTLSGKENITKLSLKRAPVQIPGIKCGILEYPYAYITHSIVHKDNMRDLI